MSMSDLAQALALIDDNQRFARFVGPRSPQLIKAAEEALDITFPPSYREFLAKLGCGSIGSAEIYGVVDENFRNSSVPDGIWLTLSDRLAANLPKCLILICSTGDGDYYAVDVSQKNDQGECPVVEWYPGLSKPGDKLRVVASDFGEFFLRMTREAVERVRKRAAGNA